MPDRGIRRIIQLIVDKASAAKAKRQMREVVDDGTDFKGAEKRAGSFFGKLRGMVVAVGAAIAAIGLDRAVRMFDRLIARGGQVLNVQRAFTRATGDQDTAIRQLRSAAKGLISDYDLMVQSNQALTLGSAANVEQVSELVHVSQQLGRALGIDAAFALNSLNTGIARQSRLYLDNLGIILSIDEANREYAETLGVQVDQLTELEKREAFRAAALKAANEAVERLGESTGTAADAWQRLNIQRKNWMDRIATTIAQSDRLAAVFQGFADRLEAGSIGEAQFGNLASVQAQIEQIDRLLDTDRGVVPTAVRKQLEATREELEVFLRILKQVHRETREFDTTTQGFRGLLALIRDQERFIETLDEGSEQERLAQLRLQALFDARNRLAQQLGREVNQANEESAAANEKVTETLEELRASLQLTDDLYELYGDRIDVVDEKTKAYETAIRSLLQNGLRPTSAAVQRLVREMDGLELAFIQQQIESGTLPRREVDPRQRLGPLGPGLGQPRPVPTFGQTDEDFEKSVQRRREAMRGLEFGAQVAAGGIADAFENAFTLMLTGFDNVENAALAVAGSMASALLQGVAAFARGKVGENIAAGFEDLAKAGEHAAAGDFAGAAVLKNAAKDRFISAAKWAVAAGAAGALAGAAGSAGRGGGGAGRTNVGDGRATRTTFRGERQGTEVHIFIDPIDPDNPLHQRTLKRGVDLARERFGAQVPVKVHRGSRTDASRGATPR